MTRWGEGLPDPGSRRPIPGWLRALWIIVCALSAIFWVTLGWLYVPGLNLLFAVMSVALVYAVFPARPRHRR